MDAKRGFVPEDEKNFSPESLETMQTASRHVFYLINEGYDLKQAATFVGNHFLLSERQRLAIMRSLATKEQLADRKRKEIPLAELSGEEVWIDGFNTIITLEVLLSDSVLFSCMDGTIRDLAALRGTYRIIPETDGAVRALFDILRETKIRKANILLDEPVSNSGRLKALIADIGEDYPFELDIQILKDVDRALYEKEAVITSDSIILDHCRSWANPVSACLARRGRQGFRAWPYDLNDKKKSPREEHPPTCPSPGFSFSVAFFFFLTFLFPGFRFIQGCDVPLGDSQFLCFVTDFPVFGVGSLLPGKELRVLGGQLFYLRDLPDSLFIKCLLGRLVKGDFFTVRLEELFAVTGLPVGFVGGTRFGIVDDVLLQRRDLRQPLLRGPDGRKQLIAFCRFLQSYRLQLFQTVDLMIPEEQESF